jgi:hypothetical protein
MDNFSSFVKNLAEFELEISNILINISEYNVEFNEWLFEKLIIQDLKIEHAILLEEIITSKPGIKSAGRLD